MSVTVTKTTEQTPNETSAPMSMQSDATGRGHPLMGLRDEIDRLFDNFFMAPWGRRIADVDPFRRVGSALAGWGDLTPRVDVRETATAYEISAELPGMEDKDIDISLREDILTIKGEKKVEREEKEANYHLQERHYGMFERSFRLPEGVDREKIEARFEKGVLTLAMPKTEKAAAESRKIEVKTS